MPSVFSLGYISSAMEVKTNLVELFLLLPVIIPRVFSQLTMSPSGFGSCQRPDIAELERILINSFNPDSEEPAVRVFEFNIVCESPGLFRDTLSSVSAVVFFECSGPQECGQTPTNLTQQVQSDCDATNTFSGVLSGNPLTTQPQATLNTPQDVNCSRCSEGSSAVLADSATHCVGKFRFLSHRSGCERCSSCQEGA